MNAFQQNLYCPPKGFSTMNMTRKNFLRWSAISAGGVVFGAALPACGGGGGGGGGGGANAATVSSGNVLATPAAVDARPAFVVSLAASRISGVAPLYVNFDATGTTHPQITNPTHDLFYSWIFGDTGAGNWANGVQSAGLTSKNAAFGPVTGHVFETPGTYTVNLVAMDGVSTVTKSVTITVQDPNVVYAGTNTICLSTSSNFTGAPSGSAKYTVSSDMYTAFNTYKASNKRLLFCKADSWVSSATVSISGLTGAFIGGYGTGAAHTFASGTLVSVIPASGIGSMFQGGGSTDCRICNFKIGADATHVAVSVSTADSSALTLYKIEVRGATAGFSSTTGGSGAGFCKQDQHCIYECLNDLVYGYAGFNPPSFVGASGAIGAPGIFTATGHKFKRYNKVRLFGTAPAGLSTGTDYYISATNLATNTFSLSLTLFPDTPVAISGVSTCDVTAIGLSGGIGAFVALTRGGFMGNYLDSCNNGEQTLRMPYLNTAHVNNNYVARPNQTKNVVKIHCRGYDDISGVSSGYSEKIVFTSNVMDLRGGYSYNVAIPNNGQVATVVGTPSIVIGNGGVSPGGERVRNAIIANNFTYGCLGNPMDLVAFVEANCPNVTTRNNIADFSIGDRATATSAPYIYTNMCFASTTTSTVDRTVGVRVYNNTMYSNQSNAETAFFVRINPGSGGNPNPAQITINNNIWYVPFHANVNKTAVFNNGGAGTNIVASNNTDNGQTAQTSPNFVATPPVALTDWRPNTGSYAIGAGATVPVLRDFNLAARVGSAYSMGAILP
jgi:hypothetical protein